MATIYDRLGGQEAVKAAVEVCYARITQDRALRPFFAATDMRAQRAHMRAFLGAALGGPQIYAGRDTRAAHAGLAITNAHFDLVVEHLAWTLVALDVCDQLIAEVAAHLAPLREQIVSAELPAAA